MSDRSDRLCTRSSWPVSDGDESFCSGGGSANDLRLKGMVGKINKGWFNELCHLDRQGTCKIYLFRFPSAITHSTSSSLQFVHGAPYSVTLQRTFLALQHRHAFCALRLFVRTGLSGSPASAKVRFREAVVAVAIVWGSACILRGRVVDTRPQ